MIPEQAFIAFLKASVPLNTATGGRMFPVTATMNQRMPFLIYNRTATDRPEHLLGDSGLLFLGIQVDVFARSYHEAKTVAELLRNRVSGYIGPITFESETRQCDMHIGGERDEYIQPTDASDTGVFRVSLDVDMSINEPFPTHN